MYSLIFIKTYVELSGLNMWRDLNKNGVAENNLNIKGSNKKEYVNHQDFEKERKVA